MTCIATLGPVGYAPAAPGTFGTLAAFFVFLVLRPAAPVHGIAVVFVVIVATVSASRAERVLNAKDPSHIVIDEFAGYMVSVLLLPPGLFTYASAFILFRFFDILKPPPIRTMERVIPGGAGVVADDLAAGLYTNMVLQLWKYLTSN